LLGVIIPNPDYTCIYLTLSEAWSGVNWADVMAAQGAFGTDFYDRSILRPKHRAYHRSGRPVIKMGPKGALGSHEIGPIHSAPSLGQSIDPQHVFFSDDILDIWMDSGVAWSILEGRVADVCIEGVDQHTGWFQSSLLTSAALREKPPTRKLLTHGFAVDENGRKMSKSVGNVVDPQKVVQNLGVDALRYDCL